MFLYFFLALVLPCFLVFCSVNFLKGLLAPWLILSSQIDCRDNFFIEYCRSENKFGSVTTRKTINKPFVQEIWKLTAKNIMHQCQTRWGLQESSMSILHQLKPLQSNICNVSLKTNQRFTNTNDYPFFLRKGKLCYYYLYYMLRHYIKLTYVSVCNVLSL